VPPAPTWRYRAALTFATLRPLMVAIALLAIATTDTGSTIPDGGTLEELATAARVLPEVSPDTPIAATFEHVFAVGECAAEAGGVATLVDCTDHSYVVLHLVDDPADCVGLDALLIYNQPHPACARVR